MPATAEHEAAIHAAIAEAEAAQAKLATVLTAGATAAEMGEGDIVSLAGAVPAIVMSKDGPRLITLSTLATFVPTVGK